MLLHAFTILTSKFDSRHNGVHVFATSEPSIVVRDRQLLTLLTLKCGSRHNSVHFFHILTSKSAPNLVCVVHFDLEMRFAALRHNSVHFLNISISKNGPRPRCFEHFDF